MLRSLQLDHNDSNTFSGSDAVFAFHAGQWAGPPVVEVIVKQAVTGSELGKNA